VARLEIAHDELARLWEDGRREAIVQRLRELGYVYVTLDLAGFQSGSANLLLKRPSERAVDREAIRRSSKTCRPDASTSTARSASSAGCRTRISGRQGRPSPGAARRCSEAVFCPARRRLRSSRSRGAWPSTTATSLPRGPIRRSRPPSPRPACPRLSRGGRLLIVRPEPGEERGLIVVAAAGTADLPVAEEAALVAEALGNRVERVYDCGVAGCTGSWITSICSPRPT